jgi:hypothetical protein
MTRIHRAAVAALIAALAIAPVASAATVTDSFSVNGTLTVTGIPATISYGNLADGTTSAVQVIDASVTANTPWQMTVTGTDFDRTGGGNLPKSVREVLLSSTGALAQFQVTPGPGAWQPFDAATLSDGTPDATGPAGAGINVRSELRVVIPGGTSAGDYSGTIEYTFTATP